MEEFTHKVTVTVEGNYPHGNKEYSRVEMSGNGDIDFILGVFRASLIAAGFSIELAGRLGVK